MNFSFDPTVESLDSFLARVDRVVLAIAVFQESTGSEQLLESGIVSVVKAKATIVNSVYEAKCKRIPTAGDMVRMLSDLFVAIS